MQALDLNWAAVIVAAVTAFILGGLWYSPAVFGGAWMRELGWQSPPEDARPGRTFGGAFVLSLIATAVFAAFLGPRPAPGFALAAGFMAGAFWVAASFGINDLFEQRSLKLTAITGGYHTLRFSIIGLILGVWH